MFTLTNISKQFGTEYALHDVSMTIEDGLNFIIGASGSGKTTLLKILSGMEQDYEGDTLYCGARIKNLKDNDASYFYRHVFGFVWQDFNLLEDKTVLENLMLPQYVGGAQSENAAMKLLRELKIAELAQQKANTLSGGQKQRVAIARELMKNPKVLLADEPTSALDKTSSKIIMDLLRSIAKKRTVIVVTHDTSFVNQSDNIYELDKGELISAPTTQPDKAKPLAHGNPNRLAFSAAWHLALGNAKSGWGRLSASLLSLLVASALLLVTVSGAISDSSQEAFDQLFSTYGQSILDISVVGSFMSAGGTDGQESDEPSANVTQNIDGLYETYQNDPRVTHIVFTQAFNDIQIEVDAKGYTVQSSGNVPTVNELTAGRMPMGAGNEVVVPNSFVDELGLKSEAAMGKSISFAGTIYNWDSGSPVAVPVSTTATIVGVVDATVKYDAGGKLMEYTVDDSFFFSKAALDEMRHQARTEQTEASFSLRTKTPADLIAIKDELNADGIVPLGRFELVEDMVRLSQQTSQQSGSAVIVISMLSLVVALAVPLMMALGRKREYAIYRVSGYSKAHLVWLTTAETLVFAILGAGLFLAASPLLHLATTALWNVPLLNGKMLLTGVGLTLCISTCAGGLTAAVATHMNPAKALMTGEK